MGMYYYIEFNDKFIISNTFQESTNFRNDEISYRGKLYLQAVIEMVQSETCQPLVQGRLSKIMNPGSIRREQVFLIEQGNASFRIKMISVMMLTNIFV